MSFSKKFPKEVPGSNFPIWEEIILSPTEEQDVEEHAKRDQFKLLDEALREARALAIKHSINDEGIVARLGVALFEKRASHIIFWKEEKAKEKFDLKNQKK